MMICFQASEEMRSVAVNTDIHNSFEKDLVGLII